MLTLLIYSTYCSQQNNDPALKCLTVGIDLDVYDMSKTDGFLPHESDWGKLGRFIGRNTHITEVSSVASPTSIMTQIAAILILKFAFLIENLRLDL